MISMIMNKRIIFFRFFQLGVLFLSIVNIVFQNSKVYLNNYNFIIGFILIVFNSWLIIVFHELGHAVSLLMNNIHIRSVYVPCFEIYFGIHIKCKVSFNWLREGLVIPEFPILRQESEFMQLKSMYLQFLLAGPIASTVFCTINVILMMIVQYIFPSVTSYCSILILNTSIQTFFLLNNCFRESGQNIGDIVAYNKVSQNNFFFSSYVYCCYFFSEDYKINIRECNYVKYVIKDYLTKADDDELRKECELLDEIIYRTITGLDNYFKDFLDDRIYMLLNILSDDLINQTQRQYLFFSTYIHALIYIIIFFHERDMALRLFMKIENLLQKQNDKTCKYLYAQMKYILNLEINKPKEIYPIPEFHKWSFYKQYYECEYKLWNPF